jgi:hypothetical protein
MATRGQIAYVINPNTIATTYIHYAGLDEGLDKTLDTFYNSDMKAKDLVMNDGDIRSIDKEGTVERYDDGGVKIIKGEDEETLFNLLYDHSGRASANYVYLWMEDDWVTVPMDKGRQYFIDTLLDQIRSVKQAIEIDEAKTELDEIFVHQMKYKAGIIK